MTNALGIPPTIAAEWMAAAVGAVLLVLLVFAAFHRILLRMSLRNIPRRRAQSILIVFGVMLATLIITASLGVGDTSNYSLQAIELRQLAGVDGAFTRTTTTVVQGAGMNDSDFFTADQAASAIDVARRDPNVASTSGAIVTPGSMVDTNSGQTSSENVDVWGLGTDFPSVWGPLHSRSGGVLNVGDLTPNDVIIGSSVADRLNAKVGDTLQVYVAGQPVTTTIRGILDTEVNPSISVHGPVTNSVLLPLAEMRTLLARPTGFNVIFVHFKGTGGYDDLGPQGATGDEVTSHIRAALTNQQSALELWSFVDTQAIKTQVRKIHDQANFLDPDKQLSQQLLDELNKQSPSDEFKSLMSNRFADRILAQAVVQSVPPSDAQSAQNELNARIAALHVDTQAAVDLKTLLAEPAVSAALQKAAANDSSQQGIAQLLQLAQQPGLTPEFSAAAGSSTVQQALHDIIRAGAPQQLDAYQQIAGRLNISQFQAYKADAVVFGQQSGIIITGALLAVSFFSICVGVLLIFLIFVMLAAERRAEMGMSRAVGLKRRHLTEMFLFEGMSYTLAATVVGVLLGILVGFLMIGVLSTIFESFYPGFALTYHIEWTSLVIAACLGILLTFVVVSVSAYRVSRLNIVAAIRDLDESEHRDAGLGTMFLNVFRTAWFGVRQLFRGHGLVFLSRVTLGVIGAIWRFWWGLFRRGPMTLILGAAIAYVGSSVQIELIYLAGVSLLIIGAGLLLRWVLTLARVRYGIAARAGFTLAALGLLVYWGQPFGRVEKLIHLGSRGTLEHVVGLDQMTGGAEVFALSALMVLLGAIWLVMFNSDLLIRGVMFFAGRVSALAPITRTSMAYPMATKFRTGMAVAMFGIVTFMVVFMSVFQNVLVQNFANASEQSGGWQIVAGTPDNNFSLTATTSYPSDLASQVSANSATAAEVSAVGWEDNSSAVQLLPVRPDGSVSQPSNGRIDGAGLHVVDDGWLSSTTFGIAPRAAGYSSDRAVWDAVRDHPGYAVADASLLDATSGRPALITSVKRSDAAFQPVQVQADPFRKGPTDASPWRLTIIGFMPHNTWGGIYVSTGTAEQSGLFTTQAIRPTGYYFALRPGTGVNKARLDLGRLLAPYAMEPVVVADQLAQQVGGILSLLKLMTGFLALGLIVGIAGLGVISTRAVVERWQQIGMLRALGYRRSMVQRSFLLESSFIAVIGLVIGAVVGIWQSYTFFVTDSTFGTVDFHVPVVEILFILAGSYLATLLTTYLPSRAAAQVAPAEALRYE
ncbi:MAG TPA: FtsX-like permease family protein [Candidatus Dormibacteraeota bacterium]|nr:FtsX-like permease family protein [Candidatus Dormibacteraeota bacterium]